jgi:hypothetical protein
VIRRLLIFLVILLGIAAVADRGLASAAGNATARQVRIHEGLKEDPSVEFRGFPFVTQAVRGRFRAVDVTARGVVRNGITFSRVDAHLEGVEVNLSKALKGRVSAVPVSRGTATVTLTYGDLSAYLSTKPGNIRLALRDGQPVVVSSFGIPGVGAVDVEGTPAVTVAGDTVRIRVSNVHTVGGERGLTTALAATAATRASFSLSMSDLPFGIEVVSASLTAEGLVVAATADGIVVDVS